MANSIMIGHPMNHYPMPEEYAPSEPAEATEPAGVTSNDAPAAAGDDFGGNLSPDALMAYCQSRLNSIDGQVRMSLDSQDTNTSSIKQIDDAMAVLSNFSGSDQKDPATVKQIETTLQGLINSLDKSDPGCASLTAIKTAYNSIVWSGDGGAAHAGSTNPDDPELLDQTLYPPDKTTKQGDGIIGSDELTKCVQTLSDAANALGSDAELQMVHLQSLMSQRQMAVTLTTNLVQSLGDQANKIADNIGH